MTKEQLAIAKEALYQYEMIRIKRLESLPDTGFLPSDEYEKKKEELKAQIKNNTLKQKMLSGKQKFFIFIAATLILALIATACVFGNEIKGFFVDFFDSFMTLDYIEDSSTSYKEYKLTWIAENYREISTTDSHSGTQTEYSNGENLICFKCAPESYFYTIVDTQLVEFDIVDLNGKEVYHKQKNDLHSFYWIGDDATFYLSCNISVEWSDIEKMILSVKCEE